MSDEKTAIQQATEKINDINAEYNYSARYSLLSELRTLLSLVEAEQKQIKVENDKIRSFVGYPASDDSRKYNLTDSLPDRVKYLVIKCQELTHLYQQKEINYQAEIARLKAEFACTKCKGKCGYKDVYGNYQYCPDCGGK